MWKKLYELFIFNRNFLLDSFAILLIHAKLLPKEKKLVLVVRLDAIGDFVLWLDSAVVLRQLFPSDKYRLVLFGNALWKELADSAALFDECMYVEKTKLYYNVRYRFNTWKTLRSRKWAVAIHPTFSRDCNCGDSVVRVSGAAKRIGSTGDLSNQPALQRWISNRWYTYLLGASSAPLMELERNAEFIRALGMKKFRAGLPNLLIKGNVLPQCAAQDYIMVVPGASLPLKQWPVEKFAELCDRVHGLCPEYKIIVSGSQSETDLGKSLIGRISDGKNGWIEDWSGKTSLMEFAMTIKNARMLIANDSSAVHVAAAVGTPAICIVGGGHFGRFVPYCLEQETVRPVPVVISHQMECYGCNMKCIQTLSSDVPGECLCRISVDDVLDKMLEILGKRE